MIITKIQKAAMTVIGENGDQMGEGFFSFHSTARGYNHINNDKVCEDSSDSYDEEELHICVVADGHGSDNYPRTDKGSDFAVRSAIECIQEFVSENTPEELVKDDGNILLKQLSEKILIKWNELVKEDYEKHPFIEDELVNVSEKYRQLYLSENDEKKAKKAYGTTLISYVVWKGCSFGLQIGDGKCVVVERDASFREPIPWDDECTFNITTSICDDNAAEEFRFYVSGTVPAAVFCGSDGIDDSYTGMEEVYALYRSMLTILGEHGKEVFEKETEEYLPVLSKKGSGDDVSVAAIIDHERTEIIAPVLKLQAEMFKLENELEKKRQQLIIKTGELRKETNGSKDLR